VLAHNLNLFEGATSSIGKVLTTLMNLGWIGVQLFFVLSGFLITGILLDTRDKQNGYRAFLARRTLRIFPLYYTVLFVAFVVLPLLRVHLPVKLASGSENQVWLWLYLSNWVEPYGRSVTLFPHFWSLAVEEQFYLVWPFVVRGLRRRSLSIVTATLVVLGLVVRMVVRFETGNVEAAYSWTICRMDALALGAMAAILLRTPAAAEWLLARARWLGATALILLGITFVATEGFPRTSFWDQSLGYTATAFAFALGIVAAVVATSRAPSGASASVFDNRLLRWIGKYSYGIYVFHLPLHLLLGKRLLGDHREPAGLLLGFGYPLAMGAVTLLLAMASYHVLEAPFLRLKSRFVAS